MVPLYIAAGAAAIVLMVGAIVVDALALARERQSGRWVYRAMRPLGGGWYALALALTVGLFLAAALAR